MMIITCPSCHSQYCVAEDALGPNGRRVKCSSCGNYWELRPEPLTLTQPVAPPDEKISRAVIERKRREAIHEINNAAAPHELIRRRQFQKRQRLLRIIGAVPWGICGLVLIIVAGTFFARREAITTIWPQAGSVFARFGQKINRTGLEIDGLTVKRGYEDNGAILSITGYVVNVSETSRKTMPLHIALHDTAGKQIQLHEVELDTHSLDPGQRAEFVARIDSPSPEAQGLKVRFADPESHTAKADSPKLRKKLDEQAHNEPQTQHATDQAHH